MTIIDSHCHLNYSSLVDRQDAVLDAARARGVTGFLNISTKVSEWDDVIAVANRQAGVWASVGVHPHEADEHHDLDARKLIAKAEEPCVIGIGETGLDFHYDRSNRDTQRNLFRMHIAVARLQQLPVIIHTRNAEPETLAILQEEMREGEFPALIHCFTASDQFAREVLDLGLFISISGIVTFKNARDLQAIAAKVPENRLLVETDAPFLAPTPNRGKVCEPAFVADTLAFLADLRGVDQASLAEQTTQNFFTLFRKARQ
ncbi:TatD family hydrolase [Croceicoccus sp. F390]|uniref:TatD family hydrolase n=1 Tax=Croceicoccus esteveae TaxID=3075597 RepID=A0ABU2ZJ55_9SPHN|nr:TatD family hydrolase [Croceicoccus sp. F390]MDT0576640.1 TatD family hydrolase [Croceicoccus sp. F390]